jgi:hypothetical protein
VQDELRGLLLKSLFAARGKNGKPWAICAATVQGARYFIESAGLILA